MEQKTKAKIKAIIEGYKTLFPEEYAAFLTYAKETREMQKDKWATVEGDHVFERKLGEIPETVHTMLTQQLTDDESKQFWGGDDNGRKSQQWFYKTFKEFRLTADI